MAPPSRSWRLRAAAVVAVTAGVVASLPAHAATKKRVHLGPNLLPNAAFEDSYGDPPGVPKYTNSQPTVPVGWAVEGLAGLFDYNQHDHHSGKRSIAISDPVGVPRSFTQQGHTVDNPLNGPKDQVGTYSSVVPAWRNLTAVTVKSGHSYQLSVWTHWALLTIGCHSFAAVRWVDANGVPISEVTAVKLISTGRNQTSQPWTQIKGVVKAPANAKSAYVLFGTDDTFISSVMFDDAYFGTYTVS